MKDDFTLAHQTENSVLNCHLSTCGLALPLCSIGSIHIIRIKTPLWIGQNDYILCPVCVSSTPANLAKATMSQFCTMPTGERKKRAAAICREVHGTNGMMLEQTNTLLLLLLLLLQDNKHCDLGSKCQGCTPALAINKLMGWFTTYGD